MKRSHAVTERHSFKRGMAKYLGIYGAVIFGECEYQICNHGVDDEENKIRAAEIDFCDFVDKYGYYMTPDQLNEAVKNINELTPYYMTRTDSGRIRIEYYDWFC